MIDKAITNRENMKLFFEHKQPHWIPDIYREATAVMPLCINEKPRGKEGFDWFGCKWIWDDHVKAGCPEVGHYRLNDITKWKKEVPFPDLDKLDFSEGKEETLKNISCDKMIYFRSQEGPFEKLRTLLGFENAFISLCEEPEACFDFMDEVANHKIRLIKKILEVYGRLDFILFPDDWGTQKAGFFNDSMYKELIYPHTKKVIDFVKNNGMYFYLHSCGSNSAYVKYMLDAGVDIWEAQETANNTVAIMKEHGKELGLFLQFCLDFSGAPDIPTKVLDHDNAIKTIHNFVDTYAPLGIIGAHTAGATPELSQEYAAELMNYSKNYYAKKIS